MVDKTKEIRPEFLAIVGVAFARGDGGLTGPTIGRIFSEYAIKFDTGIPFHSGPTSGVTKLDAFLENINSFSPKQQFLIIHELSSNPAVLRRSEEKAIEIRSQLITSYSHFNGLMKEAVVSIELIEEAMHWLDNYPEVLNLYTSAINKYGVQSFERNLLDDIRLALEILLKLLFKNNKSLEKQVSVLGSHIKKKGGSKELANMFERLIDYYSKYQNTYVKHNDSVIEEEIDFIIEISSSFMKYLVKLESN